MARTKKSTVSKIVKSIVDAPDISIINDATDLQTLITQYEQMLAALKALVAKESATISSAGYTAIVQAAITVHQDRINQLKAKLAGTGGVSANDVSYLVSQYTSQLDSYAYLGKQLCTNGYVDELSTLLPKYKNVLASLISLNATSRTAIDSSGYGPIVTGSISLHTIEIQSLEACIPASFTLPTNGIITGVRVDATVDGDTLTVVLPAGMTTAPDNKVNIRLAGCNAPEKPDSATQAGNCVLEYTYDGESSFMYVDKAFYSQATMKLGSLVGAKVVTLKVNKSKPSDSYGRLVAVVIRDDGLVANEEMLTAGLCAYFHRSEWNSTYDPVDHSKYIALESAAKVAKAGVWVTPLATNKTGQCIITAVRPTSTGGTTATSALIYVDGVYMGMTDTTDPYTLTVGEHSIRAVSSQYGIGTTTVTITENGMTTVNVTVGSSSGETEEPTDKGTVTFQALRYSSSGDYIGTSAELWENNKYKFIVESTKDNVSTDVGEHTYVFKKDGYSDKTVTVTVTKDENTLAKAILLATSSGTTDPTSQGTVDFISNPTGAKIYLNEEYIGLTKKLSYSVSPGVYTVWVKKTGYIDYTETLLVEADKKGIVDATLSLIGSGGSTEEPEPTQQTGLVDFVTSPTGAYIYIDNVYIGMTKKAGHKVAAGVHLVTFRKNGYDEWEDTIGVTANERIAVEATLTLSNPVEEEEEAEEEETTTPVSWYSYANPNYSSRQTSTSYEPSTRTVSPGGVTSEPSPTPSEAEEEEGMPVQIIVLQEDPDKEALAKAFKEVKAFFKKYCDKKLRFIATVHEPIELDTDDEEKEKLDDIDSLEDQLDMDKVQEDQGIVILLWTPSGSSVAYDGETLTRDEQLNRSIVCSIPMTEDFSKEITGTKKTTLGITSEGALTMVTTMTNALLEWYLEDHEAEEKDEELPEFNKEFCDIDEDSTKRPGIKCAKKWLVKYNKKIEE